MLQSLLLLLSAFPGLPNDAEGDFGAIWYDGRAEVSGYRWSGTRYGELRRGEAVAIFVTEPFSTELFVKLDRPTGSAGSQVTALKLNLVRDFQTGLYDYNTMVSCFVDSGDFSLIKHTFSSAEWCGHVFEELRASRRGIELDVKSYFQGESGEDVLVAKRDGVVGEQLFVLLRDLRGPFLRPGESRTLPFLASPFERRLRHTKAVWGTLEVQRPVASAEVTTPAGVFRAVEYALSSSDGRRGRVTIEEAYPHRLLAWRWEKDGAVLDAGELAGSRRLPYWELHAEGQAELRSSIGL